MSKFVPNFLLHRTWPARYDGIDEKRRARGCRHFHKVTMRTIVSSAGSESGTRGAGLMTIWCSEEEVAGCAS